MTAISPRWAKATIRQRASLWVAAGALGLGSLASAGEPASANPMFEIRPVVLTQSASPACANCGVVESVKEIQRDGSVSGLGAAAGAALGGWIANQVGGNDGKTIATIVGLLSGMWAGNAAEKHFKKEAVFEVEVRMDDGSLRTLEQSKSVAIGSRVTVDGNTLSPADATLPGAPSGVRTSV
jgi:outer membrane lipoprotein SlyB